MCRPAVDEVVTMTTAINDGPRGRCRWCQRWKVVHFHTCTRCRWSTGVVCCTGRMLNKSIACQKVDKLHCVWIRRTLDMDINIACQYYWVSAGRQHVQYSREFVKKLGNDGSRAVDYDDGAGWLAGHDPSDDAFKRRRFYTNVDSRQANTRGSDDSDPAVVDISRRFGATRAWSSTFDDAETLRSQATDGGRVGVVPCFPCGKLKIYNYVNRKNY